jgi:hypothetical protein
MYYMHQIRPAGITRRQKRAPWLIALVIGIA